MMIQYNQINYYFLGNILTPDNSNTKLKVLIEAHVTKTQIPYFIVASFTACCF